MHMEKILKALKSRTVWIAIIQAVFGILIIILTEADLVGEAMMAKSLLDIIIRALTTTPLTER